MNPVQSRPRIQHSPLDCNAVVEKGTGMRGHPYITYCTEGGGGSVRIGILRTGAYGGEGRGS